MEDRFNGSGVGFDRLRQWFRTQHKEIASPVPLAVFRIVFALALMAEIGQCIYFKEFLFSEVPFVAPDPSMRTLLLWPWLFLTFLILIGYATRFAAVAVYGISVALIGHYFMNYRLDWHVDGVFITVALMLVFMPSDRALSVRRSLDVRRHRTAGEAPPAHRRVRPIWGMALAFLVATLYLDSVFWKSSSPMWLSGLGLWGPASFPFANYHRIPALFDLSWLMLSAGYLTLVFEAVFPFTIWFRQLRIPLIILGIVLHVGISIVFPIPIFSLLMLSLYLGFVPGEVYDRIFSRRKPTTQALTAPIDDERSRQRQEWASRTTAIVLALWMTSVTIIICASPFLRTYAGVSPKVARLSNAAWKFKRVVYPWTGLSTHGVFMDDHFSDYRSQLKTTFREGSTETLLPMTTEEGLAGMYSWNRMWVTWTFNTAKPTLPATQRSTRVQRFAQFWVGDTGVDPTAGEFIVYARPVEVSLSQWVEGQLRDNCDRPWTEIAKFKLSP